MAYLSQWMHLPNLDLVGEVHYTRHYLNEVEQAFQTRHYSPKNLQLWTPALIAMVVTLCLYFLYRGIKNTNRKAKKLIA